MAKTCYFYIPADDAVVGTLTVLFFPGLGSGQSDVLANGAGGDDLTQATNAKGSYTASVDDGAGGELSGIHRVSIQDDGANLVGVNYIDMDEAAPIAVSALTSPMLLRAIAQSAVDLANLPTLAEILAGGDIDGFTLEETLKLCLAALAGKLSGADTTTITIRAADDSKDRITATVTSDGNRTAVTLDAAG